MCAKLVYTGLVRNVTFTADEQLIEQARAIARSQHKTLNVAFREWLSQYARQGEQDGVVQEYRALMARLRHVESSGPYTRDEMNER